MHVSWRVLGVPSFPFLAATIAVVVLLSLAFAWLAVTESKDYEGLASSLVVFGALGFTLFFVIFFVFQAVVESRCARGPGRVCCSGVFTVLASNTVQRVFLRCEGDGSGSNCGPSMGREALGVRDNAGCDRREHWKGICA